MNAGKSTSLLQSSYNYLERGMQTLLLAPKMDNRYGEGKITSRIGLQAEASIFGKDEDLFELVEGVVADTEIHCVMVDESQFLSREQVFQLCKVCDELHLPVLAFGIRTDFQGEPFEGSKYLLAWADNLNEIKTICHCGRKATMVLRTDEHGNVATQGQQVAIGGNGLYVSVCRGHFNEAFYSRPSPLR